MEFEWQTGDWERIFDLQLELVRRDVDRARSEDRYIVYLSCPISSRAGSFSQTNVDIAGFTQRWLMNEWGSRFWVLNPANYQLESKQGTGLVDKFARDLDISTARLDELKNDYPPGGGDYMRMWTRALVEDDGGRNLGGRFTAWYFLSPVDVHRFFSTGSSEPLTNVVEGYFARQYAIDPDFHAYFSEPFTDADNKPVLDQGAEWHRRRFEFFRYYSLRASSAYSKGSHDEWNIFVELNRLRTSAGDGPDSGVGSQLAGYFNAQQLVPSAAESPISGGYAIPRS